MAKIPFDGDVKDIKLDQKDFPPNNGEVPKVEAEIVTPKAKRQSGLRNAIISAEITDMKQFLIYDCLIPFAKNAFMNTLSMMLFNRPWEGEKPKGYSGSRVYTGSTYWSAPTRNSGLRDVSRDFIFETKQEAQEVLTGLQEWSSRAGVTTVADLCRIAGLTPEPGDNDYGWFRLSGLRIAAYGNNWYIELPRARQLS